MFNLIYTRITAAALLGFAALGLTACSELAALSGPEYQYVIAIDDEPAGDEPAGDEDEGEKGDLIASTMNVVSNRLDEMGITTHAITDTGEGQITLDVSGENSREAMETSLGTSGSLSFKLVDNRALPSDVYEGVANPGSQIFPMADGSGNVAVRRLGGIRGKYIADARAVFDEWSGQPVINITFDDMGGLKLAQLTRENVGEAMAIVLDGEVITAPIINEPILGGQLQLSGNFNHESAIELAIILRSGALPVPMKIVSQSRVE